MEHSALTAERSDASRPDAAALCAVSTSSPPVAQLATTMNTPVTTITASIAGKLCGASAVASQPIVTPTAPITI